MIDYILGKIEYKGNDHIVINNNNIGYKIFSSMNTIINVEISKEAKIYTDMVVREDDISLYGFYSTHERDVYKLLTTVKGIGPKMAIGVLSGMDTSSIIGAIRNNDVMTLTKAPGVGKKTAERIILELKDKTDDILIEGVKVDNGPIKDAEEALVQLGYSNYEASEIVSSIYEDNMSVEELIKKALKQMTR